MELLDAAIPGTHYLPMTSSDADKRLLLSTFVLASYIGGHIAVADTLDDPMRQIADEIRILKRIARKFPDKVEKASRTVTEWKEFREGLKASMN